MNLRIKLFSLLVTAAMILSLTSCSFGAGQDADSTPSPDTSDTAGTPDASGTENSSILPEDFEVDPNVEDLYLATADIPGDFELLTVNGTPVSARMYLYCLADSISTEESEMYYYYGAALDWSEEMGLAEYVTNVALNSALMYTVIPQKAKELGYDLTADQIAEFDSYTAETIEAMGGEDGFNEALRMLGLDRDTYLNINRTSYYYQQLLNGMFDDRPNDTDIQTYIEENSILSAKHILLLTMDMTTYQTLSDDEIAAKKALAEDILAQLQESSDLAADFDALMHQYSEDTGLTANPDGYTFGPGEMVTEFEEATRALEFGQISGIVESPYGYHIILRQEPDTTALHDTVRTSLVNEQLLTWINEADVVFSDEYNSLNPRLFYEKFMAYQVAFSALRQSAS